MTDEQAIEILKTWVGGREHEAVVQHYRTKLITLVKALVDEPPLSPNILQLHANLRLHLEAMVEMRLDNVDSLGLSTQAVAQFESALPQRADYLETLRQQRDDASSL